MTLSKLIKELGIPAVPHGFRSSFRDWAAERTSTPREVVEAALAHSVQNPTEANGIRFRNWCIRLADQLEEALAHQTVAAGASSFFR